jgi:holin-like protein
LKTLVLVLLFHSIGQILAALFSLPVPGTVIGLIGFLAWLLLATPPAALAEHETRAAPFLKHLGLLFIPSSVGILAHLQRFAHEGWALAAALVASVLVCVACTALAVRVFAR